MMLCFPFYLVLLDGIDFFISFQQILYLQYGGSVYSWLPAIENDCANMLNKAKAAPLCHIS